MNDLVAWDDIEKQIDASRDLKTIVEMINQMDAISILAKQIDKSNKASNKAKKYKFYLEQKGGQHYRDIKSETKNRYSSSSPDLTSKQEIETETGKTRQTLNQWVSEAIVDQETIEEFEAVCNDEDKDFTSKGCVNYYKEKTKPENTTPEIPKDKYNVIYADPPWKYTSGNQHTDEEQETVIGTHYDSMSIKELCELPISKITADNSVLFLWTTSPLLAECFDVIEAWGFKYKTSIVWDKVKHNVGNYVSVRHEFLLICTKGSFTPTMESLKLTDSVQVIERTNKHSEKPEEFRELIETLYPNEKYIELFARKETEGWDVWGNEV